MTEIPSGEETTTGEVLAEPQEKCTTQHVLTVVLRLRFLSNQIPTDRSTAGTAFLTTGSPERTAIKSELRFGILTFIECNPFCLFEKQTDRIFFYGYLFLWRFFLNFNPSGYL
jgi:hypothetical protein